MDELASLPDSALLDRLQRGAFSYITDYTDAETGLVADTSRAESPCSIAVVGFALSCYPIAVKNGWMSRTAAAKQTLKTLRSFWDSPQSDQPDATGYKGFYYHFLHMKTRRRVWQSELSLVDTTLLLAGVLMAGCYFDQDGDEAEIRTLADALYRRVDWQWAQNDGRTVAQGWKPECGFLHYGWEGYNEATILYILGLGSPTYPLPPSSFTDWTVTYQSENLLGQNVLYSGPLFTHLFSHAWIDFRGIRDKFMRDTHSTAITSRTVGIRSRSIANMPPAIPATMSDTAGTSGASPPAKARATRSCTRTIATGASSATPRAACLTDPMTAPSRPGRCWPPCRSARDRRSRERAIFWKPVRRSAARTASPAATIRHSPAPAMAGCRKAGSGWIRACWC